MRYNGKYNSGCKINHGKQVQNLMKICPKMKNF